MCGWGMSFVGLRRSVSAGVVAVVALAMFASPGSARMERRGEFARTAAEVIGSITPGGPPVTITTTVAGDNARLNFTGSVGQRVSTKITDVTLSPSGSFEVVTLRDPNNASLGSSGAVTSSGWIDTRTLAVNGTHSVFIDPNGSATGSTTVTLYDVPADPSVPIAIGGASQTATVSVPGQNVELPFYGTADQPIRLSRSGVTIAGSIVKVLRPDGSQKFSTGFVGPVNGQSDLTLDATGVHKVLVDGFQAETGSMTLTLTTRLPYAPSEQTYGACDGNGIHFRAACATASDPVNTLIGAYTTSVTDVSLPGIGVPFAFTRTYTSADTTVGRLGPGWVDSLGASLTVQSNGDVVLRAENGQQGRYARQSDGSYVGPPGALSTLTLAGGIYELVRPDQVKYRFDSTGRLLSMRDRNSQGLSLAYGGDGRLATVTDSGGRTITFSHNGDGLLSQVALADGRSVSFGYTIGRLTSVTDLRGGTIAYRYDGSGRLDQVTDQRGNLEVRNTYGGDGRVTQQLDALGNQTTFAWDQATKTATITDARNNVWKDVYSNNVLIKRIDPLSNTTQWAYDTSLNATSVTDPRGKVTTMTYDARGNLLTRTAAAPLSYQEVFTYDTQNNLLTARDGRGKTTSYEYDAAGNLVKVTQPGAIVTEYGRDAVTGVVTSVTDPRGKTTMLAYDSARNLTSVTTPLGKQTSMTHDGSGRLLSQVDPRGNESGANPNDYRTTFTYNNADLRLTAADPLGNTTSWGYDAVGNLTSETNANNRTTSYAYDAANRLTSVTAPDTTVTSYAYDVVGNLTSRTDANQHATAYAYDAANRLTSVTSPTNQLWTYEFDANGNRTKMVDAAGNASPEPNDGATTYVYDELSRPTSIDYSDTTPDVGLAYDANSNRIQMTDGAGTQTYGYDDLNRLTTVTRGTNTFSYGYTPDSRVSTRTYPDSTVTTYAYDDDARLASVTSSGATTTYSYDAAANLVQTVLPTANGHVEARTYDRAGRLTKVQSTKGGSTLTLSDYVLDPVGNPTSVTTTQEVTTYAYDNRERLTEACYTTGCTDFIRYAYDPVGNRNSQTKPAGTTTYAYNNADQLTSQSGLGGSVTYTYDANGNQTQAGSRTFTYDLANRMTSTTGGGTTLTYTYDGHGNRLQAAGGGATTKYLWDLNFDLPQLALERDGADALIRRYLYGNGRISMFSGGQAHYFHPDGLGSVMNVTSASGTTEWTYTYEPYGADRTSVQNDPGAPTTVMRFAGELLDTATSHYYLRARQYDAAAGRFLGLDPLPSAQITPYASSYLYAGARPTTHTDPSGMGAVRGLRGGDDANSRDFDALPHQFAGWANFCSKRPGGGELRRFWVVSFGEICAAARRLLRALDSGTTTLAGCYYFVCAGLSGGHGKLYLWTFAGFSSPGITVLWSPGEPETYLPYATVGGCYYVCAGNDEGRSFAGGFGNRSIWAGAGYYAPLL